MLCAHRILKQRGKLTPVARLAHQTTQKYPSGHGRYQRATARSCIRLRLGPLTSQLSWLQVARIRKSNQTVCPRNTLCKRCSTEGLNMPWRENSWRGFFFTHNQEPISSVKGKKVVLLSCCACR